VASVRISDDSGGNRDAHRGNNFDVLTTLVSRALPDLSIVINDGVSDVAPGDSLAYILSYFNNGSVAADGVVITQPIPANTAINSAVSTAGWSCSDTVCTLSLGTLAAGAIGTALFPVTVAADIPPGVTRLTSFARIASTAWGDLDANRLDNSDFEITPLVRSLPDVSVTIEDDGLPVLPGGTITYTIGYANVGSFLASGVAIIQRVPSHTTFHAAGSSAGWNCVAGSCSLAVGNLAPGASGSALFSVTADVNLSPSVRNILATTQIGDSATHGNDANRTNNSGFARTEVNHPLPNLVLSAVPITAEFSPGQTVTMTLNYTNTGSTAARGAKLTVSLPRDTMFSSTGGTSGWNCVGRTCTLDLGDVSSGASGSATISFVIGSDLSPLIRRLSVIGRLWHEGMDSDPLNNQGLWGVVVNGG
jgi:uncharacterized repeat protein (TIGR01451 family)